MKQAILIICVFVSISSSVFAGYDLNAIEGGVSWLEDKKKLPEEGGENCWEYNYSTLLNARAVRAFDAYLTSPNLRDPNETVEAKYPEVLARLWELQATNGSWDNRVSNTCGALWALMEAGESPEDPNVVLAVDWLKGRQIKGEVEDEEYGSWDNYYSDTSLAIIALVKAEGNSDEVDHAVDWLIRTHNDGEYWGNPPFTRSIWLGHEAEPVLALCMAGMCDAIEVDEAVTWIDGKMFDGETKLFDETTGIGYMTGALRAYAAGGWDRETKIVPVAVGLQSARNDDNGWGSYKGIASSGVSTATAVIALMEAGSTGGYTTPAMVWLAGEVGDDGTVEAKYEAVEPTLWAIAGLGINGEPNEVFEDALTELADCQGDDGSWSYYGIVMARGPGNNVSLAGLFLWAYDNTGFGVDIFKNGSGLAVEGVAKEFLKSARNLDGGWPNVDNEANYESDVDATQYALMGLLAYRDILPPDTPPLGLDAPIKDGLAYLFGEQFDSDYWGNTWRNSLGIMIMDRALDKDYDPIVVDLPSEKALVIDWLRNNQRADGGWGFTPEEASSVNDTSIALIALSGVFEPDDLVLISGAAWLTGVQNADSGWSNAPGSPGSNTRSTGLAIYALSLMIEREVEVTVETEEEYCPGATVQISVEVSEVVSVPSGTVTGDDGDIIELTFEGEGATYTSSFDIPGSWEPDTYSIAVNVATSDGRIGAGNKTFVVLYCPGPVLLMREPWVTSGGVHVDPSGVGELYLLWSEALDYSGKGINIVDEEDNPVLFDLTVKDVNPWILEIRFTDPPLLMYDRYTITIPDSVVSIANGVAIDGDDDGSAGGDAILIMEHRERHDSDNDNDVDIADLARMAKKWLWAVAIPYN